MMPCRRHTLSLLKSTAIALVLVLVPWAPQYAGAAEPVDSKLTEAKAHYKRGTELYETSKFEEAIKEFEIAYQLSKRPAILYNIGRAYARLGDNETSIKYLQQYLNVAPNAPDAVAVRNEMATRQHLLDEERQTRKALQEAEEARRRAAEAEAAAQKMLAEAQRATRAAREARLDAKRARYAAWPGWVFLGSGVALAAIGGGLGGLAERAETLAETGRPSSVFNRDIQSRGQAATIAGVVFDVLGGVSIGTGIGLLVWSSRGRARLDKEKRHVWLIPGHHGVALGGTF